MRGRTFWAEPCASKDTRADDSSAVCTTVREGEQDRNRDAEAIAEAVERENMRFVPIKTEDPLDVQALHGVRERRVSRRTSVINPIRSFLLERGISFHKGPASLRRQMPEILENAEEKLTARMRGLLDFLWPESTTQPATSRFWVFQCCRGCPTAVVAGLRALRD